MQVVWELDVYAIEDNMARPGGYPSLSKFNDKLIFTNFPDYEVEEASEFITSCEEEGDEEEEEERDNDKLIRNNIDKIRDSKGGIDLGLNMTDLGRVDDDRVIQRERGSRKMINYEMNENVQDFDLLSNGDADIKHNEYILPFEFGDRGSNWRMIKLNKLGRNPEHGKILEQYSTIWDYKLACLERDEVESRKRKSKSKWVFKPSKEFMRERRKYVVENDHIVKNILKEKMDKYQDTLKMGEDDKNVITMKKYNNLKISKAQQIKNELKLAHLSNLDYNDIDDYAMSREQIESLTNSP